jgi:membrane protease YdiL (CAAX protease family)
VTEPRDGAASDAPAAADRDEAAGAPVRRPIFTIEGRAAPGLYFAGWILSVVGLGLIFVAIAASGGGGPATLLLVAGGLAALSAGLVAAAGSQAIQRRADGVTGYDGPSPFLVFGAALCTTLLVSAVVSATGVLEADTSVTLVVSLLITTAVDLGMIRLLVVGPGALSWREMGLRRPAPGALLGDIGWGVLLGLAALVATATIAAVLVALLGVTPTGPIPPAKGTLDIGLNLLAAAVIAPFGEEVFFRGFATTAWARRIGPGRAIVRGALFFAIVHVLTLGGATFSEAVRIAAIAFVARLPVAWLLGWIFVRRDSLWAAIALHATFNGVAIVLAELAGRTVTGG